MNQPLPENIFLIEDLPTKEQANDRGLVLFYAKSIGWYSGFFTSPHMQDTTHWTFLPDAPATEESNVRRDFKCNEWLTSFPDLSELAESLLRMGFRAGWQQRL